MQIFVQKTGCRSQDENSFIRRKETNEGDSVSVLKN